MWIPVAFPNTTWMPVALPNDSNLRILRHIRAARAIRYPAGYRDACIFRVFALPRVGQQEGIHSTILSGSLHIYNVFCSPEWVSMVKSATPLERNDNTTTIEFTNPTVQFSQSVVQNTMWIPVAFPNTMWMLLPRQREHCVYA